MNNWTQEKDSSTVETWKCNTTGWSIYKASYAPWWFLIPPNWKKNEVQFGPYKTKLQAMNWRDKIATVVDKIHKEKNS